MGCGMKKFFASFLLTSMLGISAGSFVGVCSGGEVCHNCSRVLSNEKKEKKEKKENGGGVILRVAGSAKDFVWGVADKVTTACITVDILANGKKSVVGQYYSKMKGYADNAWNTAKKCGKATVDCAKTKVAEYTSEKGDWKITCSYCSGNKDNVSLSSVAGEVLRNCRNSLKQVLRSAVNKLYSVF